MKEINGFIKIKYIMNLNYEITIINDRKAIKSY